MTPDDLYKFYGSGYKFSKETGISTSSFYNWRKWGKVPEDAQYKIERITEGKLKTQWTIEKEKQEAKKQ